MNKMLLPGTDLLASNVIAGMMRIDSLTDEQIRALHRSALEAGINFIDHADIYGGSHTCERRWAEAIKPTAAERSELIIQTKAGIVPADSMYDFSTKHLIEAAEESLRCLTTDYLDVLLLHRPDALMEPEEVAAAFDQLHTQGKVRHFGVSNHTPLQIELLKRAVTQPLVINQLQLSIAHAPLVAEGLATNMQNLPQSIDRGAGILDYCRVNDITIQAWSPFQKGFIEGAFLGDRAEYPELNDQIDSLAAKYGVEPGAIPVAWITRHPAAMQVVLGTTNPAHLASAALGSALPLSRAEWYGLFRAAGYMVP
ncbi:MAG: aldo/keto reductase [Bifidobacteriaceae bacterium]|jgi:predicted oxidoreductase|nr:aldo/keto reductase [Bifidobacteriaceae bacterium]